MTLSSYRIRRPNPALCLQPRKRLASTKSGGVEVGFRPAASLAYCGTGPKKFAAKCPTFFCGCSVLAFRCDVTAGTPGNTTIVNWSPPHGRWFTDRFISGLAGGASARLHLAARRRYRCGLLRIADDAGSDRLAARRSDHRGMLHSFRRPRHRRGNSYRSRIGRICSWSDRWRRADEESDRGRAAISAVPAAGLHLLDMRGGLAPSAQACSAMQEGWVDLLRLSALPMSRKTSATAVLLSRPIAFAAKQRSVWANKRSPTANTSKMDCSVFALKQA